MLHVHFPLRQTDPLCLIFPRKSNNQTSLPLPYVSLPISAAVTLCHLQPVLCLLLAYENIVQALSNPLPDDSPLVLIGRTTRGEGRAVCFSCESYSVHSVATKPNADISVTTCSPAEFKRASLLASKHVGW